MNAYKNSEVILKIQTNNIIYKKISDYKNRYINDKEYKKYGVYKIFIKEENLFYLV